MAWDSIDSLDRTEAFVNRLCAFVNPEGMKAVMDKRESEMEIEQPDRTGPKPKTELPEGMIEKFDEIPEFASKRAFLLPDEEPLDEIIVGGDDARG